MKAINYKELSNPFILLFIIIIINYIIGIKGINILINSFIIFLGISILLNLFLIFNKTAKKRFYLFIHIALFSHLILIIPLFYYLKLDNPIISSFFILGLTDFLIQSYYNVLPRKDGEEIIELWKDKLIKSERQWFHPISLQKYIFKDFTVSINDSEKINPTKLHIVHLRPLKLEKIPHHIYKHQYGGKSYLFTLYVKNNKEDASGFYGNKTINGIKTNKQLLKFLKKIDKKVGNQIITAYKQGTNSNKIDPNNPYVKNDSAIREGVNNVKISIKKNYVLRNPIRIYDFLKQANKDLKS